MMEIHSFIPLLSASQMKDYVFLFSCFEGIVQQNNSEIQWLEDEVSFWEALN